MNESQARLLVGTLLAAYPRESANQETFLLWMKMIEGFDYDETERAVKRIVATRHTFPTIAALREEILEERLGLPTAEEAYAQWIDRAGPMVLNVHPFTRQVAIESGFDLWTMRQSEKPSVIRSQFLKAYEEARRRRMRAANLAELEVMTHASIEAPTRTMAAVGPAEGRSVGEVREPDGDEQEPPAEG